MRKKQSCLHCLLVCNLLFFSSCLSHRIVEPDHYTVNGTQYGVTKGNFRARWWNFYERGRSFADGGFWKEAEGDLRRALSLRSSDHRRSRTYGLHIIPYFGNRELGVVLYHLDNFEEAVLYLQRSLQQDSSEKAEYYLNRCQQELSHQFQDLEDPKIVLHPFPKITNHPQLVLAGLVTDNQFVGSIEIAEEMVNPILKKSRLSFQKQIRLQDGMNRLEIKAKDSRENTSVRTIRVQLDTEPPIISLKINSPKNVVLTAEDDLGVTLIKEKLTNLKLTGIHHNQYFFEPEPTTTFYYAEFADEANNHNGIQFDAKSIELGSFHPIHEAIPEEKQPVQIASLQLMPGFFNSGGQISHQGNKAAKQTFRIHIDSIPSRMKVFQESILIPGRLMGELKELKLNNQTKLRNCKDTRFCFRQNLNPGINHIVLQGLGTNEQEYKKTYEVERLPTPEKNRDFRAVLALCPLALDHSDRSFEARNYDRLLQKLDHSERFRIQAGREDLDLIFQEFGRVKAGYVDDKYAVKIGRILKADCSLVCTVRPSKKDVEIFSRIVDTKTKTILATCDVYEIMQENDDFSDVYERFITKLIQIFPVVQHPLERSSKGPGIALGKNANISKGMRFFAFHRDPPLKDPLTGETLAKGRIFKDGTFIVKKVDKNRSQLKPVEKDSLNQAKFVVSY